MFFTDFDLVFWVQSLFRETRRPESQHAATRPKPQPAKFQSITTSVRTSGADSTPTALKWKWQYDSKARLSQILGPGGASTRIAYTESEAEPHAAVPGAQQRLFRSDARGRLLSAEGAKGKLAIVYHASGMPAEVRGDGAPAIRYEYHGQDRLTQTRIGKRAAIRYRYDYLGRLTAITTPAGEITYDYHRATNTIVRHLPNGMQTFRRYDDEGKLAKLTHADSKNRIVAEYAYSYRPDGLIEGIGEISQRTGERSHRYQYDLMQRLIAVHGEDGERSYSYRYDSLGNLEESRTSDGQSLQLTSGATGILSSDSRGISRADARGHIRPLPGAADSIDYDFNSAGELEEAKGQNVRYSYNALGLLTARTIGGRQTRYLPDPFADAWQPLWRRDADGSEALIIWDGAVPLVEFRDGAVRYRLEDYLGSARVELDESGHITA